MSHPIVTHFRIAGRWVRAGQECIARRKEVVGRYYRRFGARLQKSPRPEFYFSLTVSGQDVLNRAKRRGHYRSDPCNHGIPAGTFCLDCRLEDRLNNYYQR